MTAKVSTKRQQLPAETKLKLMMDLTRKISSCLDLDQILDHIIDMVRSFIDYDAAGIYIIECVSKQKRVVAHTIRGYHDVKTDVCVYMKVGDGIVGWVIKTGNGAVVPDVSSDKRYLPGRRTTKSEIVAPIRVNGRIIGAFNLESDHLGAYTKYDLEMLMFFANEAAISIEKARLHEALLAKQRLEAELAIARQVQQTLLPTNDPVLGHYEIAGLNQPTAEVGGDYFDFIKISEDRLGIVIADVSGKGVPAALIMASFRASLRAQLCSECSLSKTFYQMNELLRQNNFLDQFVTAVYLDLDQSNHTVSYLNAGHNRPLILHSDGSYETLAAADLLLGLFPMQQYQQYSHPVKSGDIILLYTDGITESTPIESLEEEFGIERLVETVKTYSYLTAKELTKTIYKTVREFSGNVIQSDDCTIIVIKVS
ncbi:MAG: SpoIIE family protein phosphatase [Blastocatellia bacterium]|nr:SpoIIE family protein phosphatase [Blastocatellia bacterium]MBN8723529.1 SpoIIE family protein phosphatase [Acidobacteriota bacterium]